MAAARLRLPVRAMCATVRIAFRLSSDMRLPDSCYPDSA
jgi:hypothetical protein